MSSSATTGPWRVQQYTPRHVSWPYSEADFARMDPTTDASFYRAPRFVTHIDDAAIASLRAYYDAVLPRRGRILDLCSSWVSHYPPSVEQAAASGELRITGLGMNRAELEANAALNSGRVVMDLNDDPHVARRLAEAGAVSATDDVKKLDAATNVVSTDYLTKPVEVLASLREVTRSGGSVHLTISNRCFPTKAIARWLRVDEAERLQMVADFLHFAGWRQIEIVELSNGTSDNNAGVVGRLMGSVGFNSRDPLWVVRAIKE